MTQLLCSLTGAGFLDIQFFENLINEFSLDLDYENIIQEFWQTNINIFILSAYEEIKNMFINQNSEEIQKIIEKDPNEVDYQVFTNYLDSHLCFNNEEVEELFQDWRSKIGR